MNRPLLIIPAAGAGSRLGLDVPKVLAPINGRPMLDWLIELYAPHVERAVLVLHPATAERVAEHAAGSALAVDVELQASPTGMLDAILIPGERVRALAPATIWITWCDQVAVHPATVERLAALARDEPELDAVVPTNRTREPYIHFERDAKGRIARVLQRREGDAMPDAGESDLGLFALSRRAYLDLLPRFAESVEPGAVTRERNFLHFFAWLGDRGTQRSFSGREEIESLGVNTPADLEKVAAHLRGA